MKKPFYSFAPFDETTIFSYTLCLDSLPTTTTTYGSRSLLAKCHTCGGRNWTRLEYENGLMTHIIAAVLCLTTLVCDLFTKSKLRKFFHFSCCCCIPYCSKTCKVTRHYCSICGSYLGSNSKM